MKKLLFALTVSILLSSSAIAVNKCTSQYNRACPGLNDNELYRCIQQNFSKFEKECQSAVRKRFTAMAEANKKKLEKSKNSEQQTR